MIILFINRNKNINLINKPTEYNFHSFNKLLNSSYYISLHKTIIYNTFYHKKLINYKNFQIIYNSDL